MEPQVGKLDSWYGHCETQEFLSLLRRFTCTLHMPFPIGKQDPCRILQGFANAGRNGGEKGRGQGEADWQKQIIRNF